jgi:hypothetical protein
MRELPTDRKPIKLNGAFHKLPTDGKPIKLNGAFHMLCAILQFAIASTAKQN